MCFASNVFPEQLAPLAVSMYQCEQYILTYPIPISTTFLVKLILYWIGCRRVMMQITKI